MASWSVSYLGGVSVEGVVIQVDMPKPDLTAEVFRDGWFHTGDAVKRDADGAFYFVDRIKDVINTGGVMVAEGKVITNRTCETRAGCFISAHDAKTGKETVAWKVVAPKRIDDVTDTAVFELSELPDAYLHVTTKAATGAK